MLTTKTCNHTCDSIRGKRLTLTRQSTIDKNGDVIIYKCAINFDVIKNSSYLFAGLFPWASMTLLYLLVMAENRLLPGIALGAVVVFSVYFHFHKVVQESIFVIRDLGVQVTRTYFTGRQVSSFYPVSTVDDVVLQQAVKLHQIVSYLAVRIKMPCDKVLVKPLMQPSLNGDVLKTVYNDVHQALY